MIDIRELYNKIQQRQDTRKNLILLKAELKNQDTKAALLYLMENDYAIFDQLLTDEDAKVRKNTALIIGELGISSYLNKLYTAYKAELQLFVKSSYLTAIGELDYRDIMPDLRDRLEELNKSEIEESNKKHVYEEIRILSNLILTMEGIKTHTFTGFSEKSKVILLTNRNYKQVTLDQLKEQKSKVFNAGIIVETSHLQDILMIRTYQEMLFMLDDIKTCSGDVAVAAKQIAESSILKFLERRHKEPAPFYFRIELKSKMPLDKKSELTKKLASEVERLTNRNLVNTTSNYEIELRLIENKEGDFNVLIKLFTLKDGRFTYRKNVIPASINPVNAALSIALAKEYMKEGAQVLDPFCGVGTMLIERHKSVPAYSMYGLDIFEDAIVKARENSEIAHIITHYINRDFFDFKHEYLFDEILTDMPFSRGNNEHPEIEAIYQQFFLKLRKHLKRDGVIILYSHNREYIKKYLNASVFQVVKEYELSKVEGTYLYIIKYW